MEKKKRLLLSTIPIIVLIILFSSLYLSVGFQGTVSEGNIKIVATFYPLAYIAEQIGAEKVSVISLIEPGVEAHSWQPSMKSIITSNDADLIIYNGAGFDNWITEDILPIINTEGKIIVDTTSGLNLITNTEQTEIEEHGQYDPHTWVSPRMAILQATKIYQALLKVDPENAEYYSQNWNKLKIKLENIENEYNKKMHNLEKRVFFTTHEAFGYIARDYNLTQYSIIGLSADQQPSTQTLSEIIEIMLNEKADVFYIEPGYSDIYVQVIKEELSRKSSKEIKILKIYHMNGETDGFDYLEQMKQNLTNLNLGLNE
ncbi:zinc ABC transporter substrate-binding protein [Candidatus Bathyarchaeota archaeon]|nr:zinc ABC transporter substrate-binding protein [Candidatus Bathyarchaeota archaeon]